VEELPEARELPDPFVFMDGSRVQTKADWERRRGELKTLVQAYAYGELPPALPVQVEEVSVTALPEISAQEKEYTLSVGPEDTIKTRLLLTVPDGEGPFPAIITGDLCWRKLAPSIVEAVVGRGYLLAEFDRTAFAPDANDLTSGLHALYPNDDFGGLAAWAWGIHRVVDYLLTLPEVDAERIAVTGHSRGGKAALLAGALDERIALTAPNNSGCMGAGCTRIPHDGETLERIVSVFPYWFSTRLATFVGRETRLPFDQHSLKALVAPRALLSTEGMEDHWANPEGTQLTHQAAQIAFDFLGAGDQIGVFFRSGGHGHTPEDWNALLDFADEQRGKAPQRRFDERAYPDASAEAFGWSAPF
jgi:dienelactone hydrolase